MASRRACFAYAVCAPVARSPVRIAGEGEAAHAFEPMHHCPNLLWSRYLPPTAAYARFLLTPCNCTG